MATAAFPASVEAFRPFVDEALDRYTRFPPGCPPRLGEAIRYMLLAPGKRIRPLLVLTANQVCGGAMASALPAACAVEMIHTYSLIHDDLPAMDDDDVRRGRPSCHVQFDEPTAILAGDALIPLAFEVIATGVQPAEAAVRCGAALGRAAGAAQLVGGQADDLSHQFHEPNLDMLEQIHLRKTGALLAVSLELGGVTAAASPSDIDRLVHFGTRLGLAFQIVDDLLDLRGEASRLGKSTGKDSARGKLTYPAVLGEAASEARAEEMIQQAIASLEPFGERAEPLIQIAHFVAHRTH